MVTCKDCFDDLGAECASCDADLCDACSRKNECTDCGEPLCGECAAESKREFGRTLCPDCEGNAEAQSKTCSVDGCDKTVLYDNSENRLLCDRCHEPFCSDHLLVTRSGRMCAACKAEAMEVFAHLARCEA